MKAAKPCFRKSYLVVGLGCTAGSGESNLAVQARAGSWQNNCEGRGDAVWCWQVTYDKWPDSGGLRAKESERYLWPDGTLAR